MCNVCNALKLEIGSNLDTVLPSTVPNLQNNDNMLNSICTNTCTFKHDIIYHSTNDKDRKFRKMKVNQGHEFPMYHSTPKCINNISACTCTSECFKQKQEAILLQRRHVSGTVASPIAVDLQQQCRLANQSTNQPDLFQNTPTVILNSVDVLTRRTKSGQKVITASTSAASNSDKSNDLFTSVLENSQTVTKQNKAVEKNQLCNSTSLPCVELTSQEIKEECKMSLTPSIKRYSSGDNNRIVSVQQSNLMLDDFASPVRNSSELHNRSLKCQFSENFSAEVISRKKIESEHHTGKCCKLREQSLFDNSSEQSTSEQCGKTMDCHDTCSRKVCNLNWSCLCDAGSTVKRKRYSFRQNDSENKNEKSRMKYLNEVERRSLIQELSKAELASLLVRNKRGKHVLFCDEGTQSRFFY